MKTEKHKPRIIPEGKTLERIKEVMAYINKYEQDCLDVQIRGGYINIYYKGGNIGKISGPISITFDKNYFYHGENDGKRKANKDIDEATLLELSKKHKEIISLYKDKNYESYFQKAKLAMDGYWESLDRLEGERKDQQKISLSNNDINNDFIVVDVEFQVSTLCDYKYIGDLDKKTPRFDIIAVDVKKKQVVVIELKTGIEALSNNSGLEQHYLCFRDSINNNEQGRESAKFFIDEINNLLKQKQKLKLIHEEVRIESKEVGFLFALTYSSSSDTNKTEQEQKSEFLRKVKKDVNDKYSIIIPTMILEKGNFKLCK